MRTLKLTSLKKKHTRLLVPARPPSNQCLTDTSLFFSLLPFLCSAFAFPLFLWNVLFGWIFLQDGIEDTEMFYILQMACDHNCTAEGSCRDLITGCAVLRHHPTLCFGGACWLWLNCVVLPY